MQARTISAAIVLSLGLSACSGMSTQEQRILSGGAIGAGSGAVLGGVSGGDPFTGAVIGGALGAGAGYLYDPPSLTHSSVKS